MKILWTKTAVDHLQSIHDEILHRSPVDAKKLVHSITRRTTLVNDPHADGGKVAEFPADDIRQVFEGRYRIVYLILPESLVILAVVAGGAGQE